MGGTSPRRLRVGHVLLLVVVAAAGTLLVVRYLQAVSGAARTRATGACMALDPVVLRTAAPPFELPDLKGRPRTLSSLRGKVVLLNFWATWCPPCVEELPSMAHLQQEMARQPDFALLTISVDERAGVVSKFLQQHRGLFGSLPVLMDPGREVPARYGTTKFPETYLIDRSGTVRYRFVNKRDWSSPAALECMRSLL